MKNAEITRLFIQIVRIQQAIRTPNSKRPPAKRVALNSPRSGGFKVGTSVLTSLGSRTTGRASGLKIHQSGHI